MNITILRYRALELIDHLKVSICFHTVAPKKRLSKFAGLQPG